MKTLAFLNQCMKSIDGPEIEALADGDTPIEVLENTLNSECVDWDRCGVELMMRDNPDTTLPVAWHTFYLSDCDDFTDPEDYGVSTEPDYDAVTFAERYTEVMQLARDLEAGRV